MKSFKKLIPVFVGTAALGVVCLSFINYKAGTPLPKYKHIVVVIEENHDYNALIGSKNTPYITWLSKNGALFTDSHGVTHPSQPNYLALFAGDVQGVMDDKCLMGETPYTTPNLGAALISNGYTFNGYAETMPSVGYLPCYYQKSTLTGSYLYGRKHVPWVNWIGTKKNNIPASLSLPMTDFPTDYNKLPTVAFVIPNMDNDMHNIGASGDAATIHRGDKWLKENISKYAEWAKKHDSLLIVTCDEDDSRTDVNQIPTIFYGAHIKPGKYNEHITHYNVLHTIEAMYKLPADDKQSAGVIGDVWK
ncbi:MAG: alkaline phosphatase family protein [Sphingobacteriales bacterium]